MSSGARQVAVDSWKGYQAIALVRPSPEELAERLGLAFEPGHDDLDETLHAGIEAGSGRRFILLRHLNSPVSGTEILWDTRRDDLAEALVEVLQTLDLSLAEVVWVPRARSMEVLGGDRRLEPERVKEARR